MILCDGVPQLLNGIVAGLFSAGSGNHPLEIFSRLFCTASLTDLCLRTKSPAKPGLWPSGSSNAAPSVRADGERRRGIEALHAFHMVAQPFRYPLPRSRSPIP